MTSLLARAAARGVAAHAQCSSALPFLYHAQHILRPTSRLFVARIRVSAFSRSSIRRDDETEPDTVDAIASIGKPKRVRKSKAESTGEDGETVTKPRRVRKSKAESTGEEGEGETTTNKKPGRPKKTDGTTTKTKKPVKKKAAKKKVVKKKKAVKKKVLTAEEKEKIKIKDLKDVALLDEPKQTAIAAFGVFMAETKGEKLGTDLGSRTRDAAERYRNISSEEKEVSFRIMLLFLFLEVDTNTHVAPGADSQRQPCQVFGRAQGMG